MVPGLEVGVWVVRESTVPFLSPADCEKSNIIVVITAITIVTLSIRDALNDWVTNRVMVAI